jgi:hypothetical protein
LVYQVRLFYIRCVQPPHRFARGADVAPHDRGGGDCRQQAGETYKEDGQFRMMTKNLEKWRPRFSPFSPFFLLN